MGRLFWKIFLGFWLTLLVTGFSVGLLVHYYNQQRLAALNELVAGPWAARNVASVASTLRYGGIGAVKALFRDWPGRRPNPVLVIDHAGQDILHRPVPVAALQRARKLLASGASYPGVAKVVAPGGQTYLLFVAKDIFPRMFGAHRGRHPAPLLIWLGAGLLASLLFSLALAWYLTRPLRHLRDATRSLADGALNTRVMPRMGWRRDEISELGREFDHMAGRLQALIGAQQRLLHDVSHELRSPLARMQVAVALAHQQPEKIATALQRIERETGRLDELVAQLLTLSRLEAGVAAMPADYVDVTALLEMLVADARFETAPSGARVTLRCDCNAVVQGQVELLRQAFENVIRNGLKYAAPDTGVAVTAQCDTAIQWLEVAICNQGPGVDEADLESMFEPFVRIAQRQPEGKRMGYGLGLAIARRAIEALGGSVWAKNHPAGGLCVLLRLPVSEVIADVDSDAHSDLKREVNPAGSVQIGKESSE